jgi:RLL motif-containing protein 1
MFRRKLLALDYYRADTLDVMKDEDFRALVIWTEDQKIRHYKIEDRGGLRDLDNPKWDLAFEQFWIDVGFPLGLKDLQRTQVSIVSIILI